MSSTTKPTGVFCRKGDHYEKQWGFRCPKCGHATGTDVHPNSRDGARELYKAHRATCTGDAAKPKADKPKADKPKAVDKPKADKPKAVDKPKAKKEKSGICARVWAIADEVLKNKNATPSDVYAKCEGEGINPSTCRVQFGHYCREKFNQSPREKWGSPKQTVARVKGKKPAVVLNPAADKDVPQLSSAKYKDGWTSRQLDIAGVFEDVITSPDDVSYIRARANEKADLLVNHKIKGLQQSRWRKLEDSAKSTRAAKTARAKAARKTVKRKQ